MIAVALIASHDRIRLTDPL